MQTQQTFAEWLSHALIHQGVEVAHLATAIDCTPAAVHAWLGGKRPGSPSVVRVLDALGVDDAQESAAWRAFRRTVRESL